MKRSICAQCGRIFTQGNAGKRELCLDCRSKQPIRSKDYAVCKHCGKAFERLRKHQVFCCLKCRQGWYAKPAPMYNKRCAYLPCSSEFEGHERQRYCCKKHAYLAGREPENRRLEGAADYVDEADYFKVRRRAL